MNPATSAGPNNDWPAEQARWCNYYLQRLEAQLAWATACAGRPERLVAHCDSLLALLACAHRHPHLHTRAVELIATLGAWPAYWGRWHAWEEMLRFGLSVVDAEREPDCHFALLIELAYLVLDTGRLEEAMQIGLEIVERASVETAPVPLTRAVGLIVQIYIRQGAMDAAQNLLEQLEPRLQRFADAHLALAYFEIFRAGLLRRQGKMDEAVACIDRAVGLLETSFAEERHLLGDAYVSRGAIYWAQGRYAPAAADFNRATGLFADSGDSYAEARARGNLGIMYWSMGELERAEQLFRQMLSVTEQRGARWQMAVYIGLLALVYQARGEMKQALAYGEQHLRLATQNDDTLEIMRARGIRGTALLYLGDLSGALADLEAEQAFHQGRGSREGLICNYVSYAPCLAGLGRKDEAVAVAREALTIARKIGSLSMQVIALRCLAEQSPPSEQKPLLQEALSLARQTGRRLDEAACLLSLAVLKEGSEQIALWKEGARLLEKMGATAWLKGHSLKNPPQIVMMG